LLSLTDLVKDKKANQVKLDAVRLGLTIGGTVHAYAYASSDTPACARIWWLITWTDAQVSRACTSWPTGSSQGCGGPRTRGTVSSAAPSLASRFSSRPRVRRRRRLSIHLATLARTVQVAHIHAARCDDIQTNTQRTDERQRSICSRDWPSASTTS
jgi:hypothetical protein